MIIFVFCLKEPKTLSFTGLVVSISAMSDIEEEYKWVKYHHFTANAANLTFTCVLFVCFFLLSLHHASSEQAEGRLRLAEGFAEACVFPRSSLPTRPGLFSSQRRSKRKRRLSRPTRKRRRMEEVGLKKAVPVLGWWPEKHFFSFRTFFFFLHAQLIPQRFIYFCYHPAKYVDPCFGETLPWKPLFLAVMNCLLGLAVHLRFDTPCRRM